MQRGSDISETYSKMSNDEILRLALQEDTLLHLGQVALTTEMKKRGMDETSVVNFRLREEEAARQESQQMTSEKQARAKNRLKPFKQLGIFLTAALVTVWLASKLFNLSNEVVYHLTSFSLYGALAVFGLAKVFGGTWLTVGKTIVLAAGLSVCLLVWVYYIAATAAK